MKHLACVAQTLTACLLLAVAGPAGAQQEFPNKPIRFILPYPPGGATTPVGRLVGQKLTESWNQAVIVDNRGGGNTIIGTETVARSPADGYTIGMVASAFAINPSLMPTPYDEVKDFAPVATLIGAEFLLVVHPSVAAGNLKEFIALAKSKPETLNYASSGNGSSNHLATELLNILAGIKMRHIPYKGGGPALADLLGGQVQVLINLPVALMPHVKSGKLKAIAIGGDSRSPALPQVPTFTEAGLPGLNAKEWMGVLAPAGTPKAVVGKLSAEIGRILALPDVRDKLTSQGLDPFISTSEQFAAMIRADLVKYAKIVKTAGIKADQ